MPDHGESEPKRTVQDIADEFSLSVSKVTEMFIDEPDVIRIGHPTLRHRRQYYTLRIPQSVVDRVFGSLTVRRGQR